MRKALIFALVIGLIAGSMMAPAMAKKKKKKKKPVKVERVVESTYDAPAIGAAPPGTGVCLNPTNSCGNIAVGAEENYVKLSIADATGLPVAFSLGQDTDPATLGTEKDLGQYCGDTGEEPIQLEPGFAIVVFPWAVGASCGAVATTGTVTATISNIP
jgi:hypothetical protein